MVLQLARNQVNAPEVFLFKTLEALELAGREHHCGAT
jgi:hypothetical protein